jgi:predicted DNA-binding transcriptional regulator AlpA
MNTELDGLLTAKVVAQMLGVRVKRVYELGIPAVRLAPRTLRWRRSDVEAWLTKRAA